jgi:hypothetical protein
VNSQFFELLYADREFCEAMGRATLAAGRFESTLGAFLRAKGVAVPEGHASFGWLIGALEKHSFLNDNGVQVLRDVKRQRNYLTHSLFDLFAGRIPETVLPRTGLVPMDVDVFTEKARVLEDNRLGLSRIAERKLEELLSRPTHRPSADDRLFRP